MQPWTLLGAPAMSIGPINVIINLVMAGPVPTFPPIPNMGIGTPPLPGVPNVLMTGAPVVNLACLGPITAFLVSIIPIAGVESGTILGPTKPFIGAPNVTAGGLSVVLCVIGLAELNLVNDIGMCVASPTNVIIMP